MARLQDRYREEIVPELMKEFGYSNVMQVPELEKIVRQCRPRGGDQQRQSDSTARSAICGDHRSKASGDSGQEVDRGVQAAGRNADRRNGDVARTAYV